MNWLEATVKCKHQDKPFVLITIIAVEGSAPRDVEAKMVVDNETIHDSIGGGNLEYQAIAQAREMLLQKQQRIRQQTFILGQDLTQCCGGKVTLLFEYFPAKNFHVVLFGAGHVATALVKILLDLPCTVQWIDSRKSVIESMQEENWGVNTTIQYHRNPEIEVENCPSDSYYLVMTHSHAIDMEVVEAILSRGDIRFCGLIGSKSKAANFSSRLAKKQFSEQECSRLTCPVGLTAIKGKSPTEVAVSISAQLLALKSEEI